MSEEGDSWTQYHDLEAETQVHHHRHLCMIVPSVRLVGDHTRLND